MMITLAIDHGPKHILQKGLLCDWCEHQAIVLISNRNSPIGFTVPPEASGWLLREGRDLLLGISLCPSCKDKQRQQDCQHLRCEAGSQRCLDCGKQT